MNKKLISFAVMAGLASTASAVNVNPDGLGQVLLFPYYTTNGGKVSAITIVNTTNDAKAVKVRFSEGVNTWEVLDFNLYLSPYDVWVAGIGQNTSGTAVIFSDDTSCISPRYLGSYSAGGQAFRDHNITKYGTGSTTVEPTNVATADRLKEGHIELLEMGVLDNSSRVFSSNSRTLAGTVTHANGTPADCSQVASTMWSTTGSNGWATDSTNLVGSPTGGLFGSIDIVDVSKGIGRSYDAVAIDAFFDNSKFNGVSHSRPGNSFPNLNGEMLTNDNISSLRKVGSVDSITFNNGTANQARWSETIDALSAALSVNSISNLYYIGDDLGAATDWVVSFPTKHYYVNERTANVADGQYGVASVNVSGTTKTIDIAPPFGDALDGVHNDSLGVSISVSVYDREEATFTPALDFSPSSTPTDSLAYEVNIIEFDESRDVLDSVLANTIQGVNYTGGWAKLNFSSSYQMTSIDTTATTGRAAQIYTGLPAIGFSAYEATNASTLANYSMIYQHKYTRSISISN